MRLQGDTVTSYRLLLLNELVPAAEAMCGALRSPCAVVSEKAVWDRPKHCLYQIDLPSLHARVLEEVARLRGVSVESLLFAWIDRCRTELAVNGPEGPPHGILARSRLLAEWEELGYSGGESGVRELARKLARE